MAYYAISEAQRLEFPAKTFLYLLSSDRVYTLKWLTFFRRRKAMLTLIQWWTEAHLLCFTGRCYSKTGCSEIFFGVLLSMSAASCQVKTCQLQYIGLLSFVVVVVVFLSLTSLTIVLTANVSGDYFYLLVLCMYYAWLQRPSHHHHHDHLHLHQHSCLSSRSHSRSLKPHVFLWGILYHHWRGHSEFLTRVCEILKRNLQAAILVSNQYICQTGCQSRHNERKWKNSLKCFQIILQN